MQQNKYWQRYADELDEQDIYNHIIRAFQDDDSYARGSGSSGGTSSSSRRGSSNNYHSNPDEALKKLAEAHSKIQDFFLSLGYNIQDFQQPSSAESNRRGR